MQSSKVKTLLIYKYLEEYSDEENPVSTTDLIEKLEEYGIKCERKSIYSDIETLKEFGCDIISATAPKRGYFIASRKFEIPEIRLLIDAVSSAAFITPIKTEALIKKLESLLSKNQSENLTSQVYFDKNAKCNNEEIYYVIDGLDDAIKHNKKVKFNYTRRNIDKENQKAFKTKEFIVSPYSLLWKKDNYYLVCNNGKYDNLMNLRLDRISKVVVLDENARNVNEVSEYKDKFDSADYSSKMFNMFTGENNEVELLCHLDLREEIIDRFGNDVPLKIEDMDHFKTTFNAAISDGLVSWIMQYGDKMKVIKPDYLIDMIKDKAFKIYSNY